MVEEKMEQWDKERVKVEEVMVEEEVVEEVVVEVVVVEVVQGVEAGKEEVLRIVAVSC